MKLRRREFIRTTALAAGAWGLRSNAFQPEIDPAIQEGDKLVLLGTQGGPFIRSYKQTPSANLIVYKGTPFVIDTGYGTTFKLREAGFDLSMLKYIFITHHHSDHNLDLGPLLYNAWIAGLSTPVHVYGPRGLKSLLRFYWKSNSFDIETRIRDEKRPDIRKLVTGHEYSTGTVLSTDTFEVSVIKNFHPPIHDSYAIKFKLGEKNIVFSGDTAYYPPLAEFAIHADYLVHEVMYVPAVEEMVKRRPNVAGLKASILSHHTSAEDVGKIASAAGVKNLILTHFVPPDDKKLTEQVWIEAVGHHFTGNIIVGKDLLQLNL